MIVQRLPHKSIPRFPIARFSAPVLAGQFDFGIAANADRPLMDLQPHCVYAITNISFFAQGGQDLWLTAMDTEANFPVFELKVEGDKTPLFAEPTRCVDFLDAVETSVYFQTQKTGSRLLISFRGIVNNVAGYIAAGIDPLACVVDLQIMQVTDMEWIRAYNTGTLPKF